MTIQKGIEQEKDWKTRWLIFEQRQNDYDTKRVRHERKQDQLEQTASQEQAFYQQVFQLELDEPLRNQLQEYADESHHFQWKDFNQLEEEAEVLTKERKQLVEQEETLLVARKRLYEAEKE